MKTEVRMNDMVDLVRRYPKKGIVSGLDSASKGVMVILRR